MPSPRGRRASLLDIVILNLEDNKAHCIPLSNPYWSTRRRSSHRHFVPQSHNRVLHASCLKSPHLISLFFAAVNGNEIFRMHWTRETQEKKRRMHAAKQKNKKQKKTRVRTSPMRILVMPNVALHRVLVDSTLE